MTEQQRPMLRIVRGNPDDTEIAALTAVVASAGSAEEPAPKPRRSLWANRAALLRKPAQPGAGAWRASGQPN